MKLLNDVVTTGFIAPVRVEHPVPIEYRLAHKADGSLILQGKFVWQKGFVESGFEWRDIPTVEIEK